MRKIALFLGTVFVFASTVSAQFTRWQQEANYIMKIDMDEPKHQFDGEQEIIYINHSPDTLNQIFYHLYFNAFQPNSMMDTRSRSILDPDGRVRDRIAGLSEEEIGYHDVESLSIDGETVDFEIVGTLLEANLPKLIMPGDTVRLEMTFNSQVPLQIRRSGRDNREGIDFSMTQWYPKLAEYDYRGWHTSPYVGREFYGVFGNFDVFITMDNSYTIGGSGVLQNADEIGKGYSDANPSAERLTWHFRAENVHTFAWAADPDFTHYQTETSNGTKVHIIYQEKNNPSTDYWEELGEYTAQAIDFMNEKYGEYPYPQFTVIQGGDGGMEYPMATLITGHRSLGSLVGVMVHELAHMWYYGVLATNEAYYPWMDEGFTVFASNEVMAHLFNRPGDPHARGYGGFLYLKNTGLEEALDTHADRYETNLAYGQASYTMGSIFLNQLGYIVGRENLYKGLKRYFETWKFKHPNEYDFIREVEKVSNIELDWYISDWVKSTKTIDYAIDEVEDEGDGTTEIELKRVGDHLMPIDVFVTLKDGSMRVYNIPTRLMRGAKKNEFGSFEYFVLDDWRWVDEEYEFTIDVPEDQIEKVELDASLRLADVNRLNNSYPFPVNRTFLEPAQPSWQNYGYTWRPAVWYGDQSGVRLGIDTYGEYIFGQNSFDGALWLTSGPTDDLGASNLDVDYELTYRHKLEQFGNEAYVIPSVRRYYGIGEESITFEKRIGKYGVRSPDLRMMKVSFFHQRSYTNRNVFPLNSWQGGSVVGTRFSYEVGNASKNGVLLNTQIASIGNNLSASLATLKANKTYDWASGRLSTRFGFEAGTGSRNLPVQYNFTLAGSNPNGEWRNATYWSVANIDPSLVQDLNMYTSIQNGLLGYGLPGIGSPDAAFQNGLAVNNFYTFTIWNTISPFKSGSLSLFELEVFAGAGQNWHGNFISEFPLTTDTNSDLIMASMGVGATYDVSKLRSISKWTAQSDFLQNLKLSIRMPFFLNGLEGNDDFGTWFLFGVSDNF